MVKRIEYIDNLKCFAIFLVVLGHAVQIIWSDWQGSDIPLYVFIYSFHMPLFMFLSGLCVNISTLNYKVILKKVCTLLWPYLLWSLFRCTMQGENFVDGVILKIHGGYWFLLCLFEIFLLFIPLSLFEKKINFDSVFTKDLLYWGTTVVGIYVLYRFVIQNSFLEIIFNLDMLKNMWAYFIFGYIVKKYDFIEQIITKDKCHAIFSLLFISLVILRIFNLVNYNVVGILALSITGIITFYGLFRHLKFSKCLQGYISEIGCTTLNIYILHVFFFEGLDVLFPYVANLKDNILILLLISSIVSMINIFVCWIISKLLYQNRFLELILFGISRK